MRPLFCIILLSSSTLCSFGQYSSAYRTNINFQTQSQGFLTALTPAPKEKTGSVHLYEEWLRGDVFLRDSTKLTGLSIKIDLRENVLDILHNQEVKVLPVSKLLAVSLLKGDGRNELYVNSSTVLGKRSPHTNQFLQVLTEGDVSLYSRRSVRIIEARPPQQPVLRTIDDDEDKVEIGKIYFITYQQSVIEVDSKSQLKEDLTKAFGVDVTSYLKKSNLKKESDLLVLVNKLSELNKPGKQ